jgi:PGF-CTERM protein
MKIKIVAIMVALFVLVSIALAAEYDSNAMENESQKNIVETAIAAGNFNTLVEAVKATGLTDTLSSPGPFTVFAPTDEAFAKVPKSVMDALIANKTLLTYVLTYHVVPGEVISSDLKNDMSVKTVQGSDIKITIDAGGVMVNNAKVTNPDIKASNGVIHVIDTVILPSDVTKAVGGLASASVAEATGKVEEAAMMAEETAKKAEGAATQAEEAAKESTPGFEILLAIAGLLSMALMAVSRRD